MDEREFEDMLERVMKADFSAGTEAFREGLLARCLAELDADALTIDLDAADLELLAAAGDATRTWGSLTSGGGGTTSALHPGLNS